VSRQRSLARGQLGHECPQGPAGRFARRPHGSTPTSPDGTAAPAPPRRSRRNRSAAAARTARQPADGDLASRAANDHLENIPSPWHLMSRQVAARPCLQPSQRLVVGRTEPWPPPLSLRGGRRNCREQPPCYAADWAFRTAAPPFRSSATSPARRSSCSPLRANVQERADELVGRGRRSLARCFGPS
jgi:hypothetical protein